jgi:hypothetical protein
VNDIQAQERYMEHMRSLMHSLGLTEAQVRRAMEPTVVWFEGPKEEQAHDAATPPHTQGRTTEPQG